MITREAANRLKYAITDLSHIWPPVRVFRRWLCKKYHLDEMNMFLNGRLQINEYPVPLTLTDMNNNTWTQYFEWEHGSNTWTACDTFKLNYEERVVIENPDAVVKVKRID